MKHLPVITLTSSTPVSDTELTVAGTIDNGGVSTVWSIEYGATTALGSTATGGTITEPTAITKALTGLSAYTRYYWRIKAVNVKGTTYSSRQFGATSVDFGWITNQAGSNVNVVINTLNIAAGKTVTIDWGDSTTNNYTGNNANITKTYTSLGQFIIKFSGDVNSITSFAHKSQARSIGDISNWTLPTSLTRFELYQNANITGYLDSWTIPTGCTTAFILVDCGKLNGNPLLNGIPTGLNELILTGAKLSGDMSSVELNSGFSSLLAGNCNYTKLPRGNFRSVQALNFSNNNCSIAELDSFLLYLDNYFTGTITPLANAVYTLTGDSMNTPTGGINNTNLLSVVSKYIAAGRTCTISVNNYQVAYSDNASKLQLTIPTYEGSGETVHPSVLNLGQQWNGYQYWMANTPFPGGASAYENPSIWASNNGTDWVVPAGITNPIIDKPDGNSFNADSEIYFENNTLYLIWKENLLGVSKTKLTSTQNLTDWTTPVVIADPADDQGDTGEQASPQIVKLGETYYMYYVTLTPGNYKIRRRSCATINGNYSAAEDIVLTKLATRGYWHISVRLFDSTVWLAANVTVVDNTNAGGYYIIMAKSADGIAFTRDADALPTICETELEMSGSIYKPALMYVDSQLVCYYSHKEPVDTTIWKTSKVNVFIV